MTKIKRKFIRKVEGSYWDTIWFFLIIMEAIILVINIWIPILSFSLFNKIVGSIVLLAIIVYSLTSEKIAELKKRKVIYEEI